MSAQDLAVAVAALEAEVAALRREVAELKADPREGVDLVAEGHRRFRARVRAVREGQ